MASSCEILIIGGGAAGLSAALVLGRARRDVLVVDAGHPRNERASHMHGFLTRDGMDPAELLAAGRKEVEGYGVSIVTDEVSGLQRVDKGFVAELASGGQVVARRVVIASGMTDTLPDLPGLREGWAVDVLHCPYCHGYEVRDQRLAVLGTTPMSGHQAMLVSQWSSDVLFFPNGVAAPDDEARGRLERRGVRIVEDGVTGIARDNGRLVGVVTASGETIPVDAVFAGGEMRPSDRLLESFAADYVETPVGPFVKTDESGQTSVPGIWAVGNVSNPMAQVIVAASAGSQAAAAINADLIEEDSAPSRVSL